MRILNQHRRGLLKTGLTLGLLVGLAGVALAMTPLGRWLEEDIGLSMLFKLRGSRPAPVEVVVVSIDRASSQQLGLPNKPRKWPRALHADLVRKLSQHGATAIAFDIIFEETREPDDNRRFADAMREAGNVVLFQYLKKDAIAISSPNGQRQREAQVETLVSPIPELKQAAFGLAPFPLPKVPAQVNHFVLFKPKLGHVPTWPMAALQVYALPVYDEFRALLASELGDEARQLPANMAQVRANGEIHQLSQQLRRLFERHPKLKRRLTQRVEARSNSFSVQDRNLISALIDSYAYPKSLYLNFYGPPRSITTIPYHKVLTLSDNDTGMDFSNKAVFVGFSEQFQPEQKDGFYTVFSQEKSGLDVSGVEIGATAFANLLTRDVLKVPSTKMDLGIFLLWGIFLGIMLRVLPGPLLIPATLIFCVGYFMAGYYSFDTHNYWLPLATPILWQAPLCLLAALLWKYLESQRERRNIRQAFGYHLPANVVDQLAKGVDHITSTGQHAYGIVLATDAEQYTALSENLDPGALRDLMNRYYKTLFEPIRNAKGIISDVVGDAAVAIWASAEPDAMKRRQACQAALQIRAAVEKFNQQQPEFALPTRMGLHFGEVVMGHVGAMDHYEYRAVGDIVNTASRIEGLNKQLGTRILVSHEVLDGLDGFRSREVGMFRLVGKSKPLTLYELIAERANQADMPNIDYSLFSRALLAFQEKRWYDALDGFSSFIARYGEDGPSRYYLALNEQYRMSPPENWDGVVKLARK